MAWVLILVLGLVPPLLREAHTDIAWPFYLAEQMLSGARQGADFLEVNPPLFLWLAVPPVLLERLSGLDAWQANVLLTALLAAVSLVLMHRILRLLVVDSRSRHTVLLTAGFAAFVLPRIDFSQREHLAYIAALPYVVLAAARLRRLAPSPAVAVLAGVLGGMGFSLKPHFLVAWLLLELLVLARLGRGAVKRIELGTLVGFGVLYLMAVVLFVPDYLPMAFRLRPWYERYLDNGLGGAAVRAGPILLLTVLIALAQRRAAHAEDPLDSCLSVTFLGFLAAAILQRKGFSYHYVAASSLGLILLVRGRQTLGPGQGLRPSSLLGRSGILLVVIVLARGSADAVRELANPEAGRYRTDPTYPLLLPVVKQLAGGQSLVVLSANPLTGWPLTRDAGATWASRYMSFWPLQALYDEQLWDDPPRLVRPHPPDQRPPFEIRFVDEVVEDLERWRPRLIVVLEPDPAVLAWGGARRFDYLEYFGTDPRFAALFRGYRRVSTVGPYGLWLRAGP